MENRRIRERTSNILEGGDTSPLLPWFRKSGAANPCDTLNIESWTIGCGHEDRACLGCCHLTNGGGMGELPYQIGGLSIGQGGLLVIDEVVVMDYSYWKARCFAGSGSSVHGFRVGTCIDLSETSDLGTDIGMAQPAMRHLPRINLKLF